MSNLAVHWRDDGSGDPRHSPSRRRHDAVTDAALWARLRDGSLTLAGNWRLKIYGRLGCPAGRIRCLEIGGEFRHTGDVVP